MLHCCLKVVLFFLTGFCWRCYVALLFKGCLFFLK